MDWTLAISRNRDQLRQIVLALFAIARMRVGGFLFFLPRDAMSAIMLVLRPAESAVRRLIVIAAFGLKPLTSPRLRGPEASPWSGPGCAGCRGDDLDRTMAFQLFDPLKHFAFEDFWDHARRMHAIATRPFDPYAANHIVLADPTRAEARLLGLRLNALMRAIDDIPAQARRLVRWQARRAAAKAAGRTWRPRRSCPMRPGLPPGWRERKIHEIDQVLRECHALANYRLDGPNTS